MRQLQKIWRKFGVVLYNTALTHVPSHHVRLNALRLWGARIGRGCSILRGTTVLAIENLVIGDECSIGFRCVLDARGGLTFGSRVVVASDTHFIAGYHDIHRAGFLPVVVPTVVEDYVWLAARATVECGVTLGRGSVVGTCALVRHDVPPMKVVAGVPAREIGERPDLLDYSPVFRPWFF